MDMYGISSETKIDDAVITWDKAPSTKIPTQTAGHTVREGHARVSMASGSACIKFVVLLTLLNARRQAQLGRGSCT